MLEYSKRGNNILFFYVYLMKVKSKNSLLTRFEKFPGGLNLRKIAAGNIKPLLCDRQLRNAQKNSVKVKIEIIQYIYIENEIFEEKKISLRNFKTP